MEVSGIAIVTCCDAAEVLEAVEHALNGISRPIKDRRKAVLPDPVDLGRDVRRGALVLDLSTHRVGVVALVAVDQPDVRDLFLQRDRCRAIRDVAAGQHEGDRPAGGIRQRVDLGRAPATRSADGLLSLPFFPPEAQRWAFTAELSIRSSAGGPSLCASASNRRAQTPFAAQR